MEKMDSIKTLTEYFENGCEIFSRMPTNLVPWNDFFTLSDMDYDFINQYGSRYACSYLKKIDYSITANRDKLSADIIRFHYHKWKHLWIAYTAEYNPTDNTFLTETVTREVEKGDNGTVTREVEKGDNGTVTREVETGDSGTVTNNLTRGETGTVKNDINRNDVSTQTGKKTTTTDNDVYGFNGGAVNDTAGTTNETIDANNPLRTSETHTGNTQDTFNKQYTDTGTVTNSNTGTESESVTNSNTGTESESVTNSNTGTESETVTTERAGSIGVMTPATMLKIERETWQWNYFRDVMNDVADFISLQIFD
jgi:hypothetical protein